MSLSVRDAAGAWGGSSALVFDDVAIHWADLWARVRRAPVEDGTAVVVAQRDLGSLVRIFAAIERRVPLVLLSPRSTEAERRAQRESVDRHAFEGESPLACIFTSGSTGAPRGALLSRRAFAASAEASARGMPLGPGDRWLASMPLSHVGGLSILTRALSAGSAVVVAPEGPWDARAMVSRMDAQGVTHASVVPTMLARIVESGLAPPASLRALLVGGAACPVALALRARAAGWPVRQTYGLTEACSQVATRAAEDEEDEPGRIGRPLPGLDVRVVASQIEVRGPTLFDGYLGGGNDGLTPDGFFATGDVGRLDDQGVLFVEGRADDLIVTGGENVHPATVEAVVASHPDVRACCVFGVADDEWGQVVSAAVVGDVDEASLASFVAERTSAHARPRRFFFLSSLSETPSGKVDRAAVRRACLRAGAGERRG